MSDENQQPAVLTEVKGKVMLITLNRPEAMNSINAALANGLWAAIEQLNADEDLTAGVLTGAGRGFSAGMDLKAFLKGEDLSKFMTFIENGCEKPLIGAIENLALAGGLELALTCDLLVATAGARLGIPEVTVGLFAAAGGLYRLPSRVGYGKAMEMALTGEPITAEEGYQYGLITRVVESGESVDAALELAERVAKNAPLAVAASKQLVRASLGVTEAEFWDLQKPHSAKVFTSNDANEGPRAFAEKRAPNWTGK